MNTDRSFMVAFFILVIAMVVLAVSDAYCFSCWDTTCLDSAMCGGDDCVCIRTNMGEMGYCASIG